VKKWYRSKTLWTNVIAILGGVSAEQAGVPVSPDVGVGILGLINVILRITTKEGLSG
jgi:hypothetical protein